jgi:hypothetical protein
MASKADLIKDLDFLSDQLSDRSRKIAFAVLAIWWALLVGDKVPPGMTPQAMLWPVAFATLSVFADFSQYGIAYMYSTRLLRNLEISGRDTFHYDTGALLYKARRMFFYCKHCFSFVAIIWFIVLVVQATF